MNLLTTYKNGNREAKVYLSLGGYTVEYNIGGKVLNKTHHTTQELAEDVADDFITEAGAQQQLLNEER